MRTRGQFTAEFLFRPTTHLMKLMNDVGDAARGDTEAHVELASAHQSHVGKAL